MPRANGLSLVLCALSWLLSAACLAEDLTITNFTQTASRRISQYEFEYTLRADLANSGPAVKKAGATVSGKPAHVTVLDGALTFGDVAAGATVTSLDTFSVKVDRRLGFQPTDLVWNISYESGQDLIARFRIAPESGNAPLKITFYPEPVTNTAVQRYDWDFDGNGTFDLSDTIGNSQTFTYNQPGTYRPALRVTDARGQQDTQSRTLTVGNAPPVITSAQVTPSNGQVPLIANFSATATDSDGIALYEWDFEGDGTYDFSSSTSASTTHSYTVVGTYRPVLRVKDRLGASATLLAPATEVRAAPVGSPTVTGNASPRSGSVPLSVSFSGSVTDPQGKTVSQWQWDFQGDGTYDFSSSTSASTTYVYTSAGTFYPRLRVSMVDGRTAETVLTITAASQYALQLSTDTLDTAAQNTVTVKTTLGGNTRVSVVIENVLKGVVKTLVPWTTRTAGVYDDVWNGTDEAGATVPEGTYYAILLYEENGATKRLDLALTTGGQQYNPPRTPIPYNFSPLAGQPLVIDFTLSRASEVTAFMGRFNTNVRLITFLQREPLGRGTHRITWNGEDSAGQLIHPPPGDQFLFGIFAYYLPDNAIYVRSGAHVTNLSVAPSIFDPTGHQNDQGALNRSALTFTLNKPANAEVVVSDAVSGAAVARRFFTGLKTGSNTVYWDGRDDQNRLVTPGRYRLGVAAVDGSGYRSLLVYALQRVYY